MQSADKTDFVTLPAASVILDQVLSAPTLLSVVGTKSTIVRTRGMFSVGSDQGLAAEFPFGAFGIAVVSNDAASAGAGSIPSPYTDAFWD